MTSYEFEVAAKNAVIKRNFDCNEYYKIQDISNEYCLDNEICVVDLT